MTSSFDIQISKEKIHKTTDESFPKISCMTNLGLQRRNSDIKKTSHIESSIYLFLKQEQCNQKPINRTVFLAKRGKGKRRIEDGGKKERQLSFTVMERREVLVVVFVF